MRRRDRQADLVEAVDGAHRGQLGAGTLGISHVGFADLLADRDDDALPSDHRAESQRHRDLDPGRNVLRRLIQEPLVVADDLLVAGLDLGAKLRKQPESLTHQVHLVADDVCSIR